MILKLSLNGFKKQWRDYIVLFSGLIVAATIFYMFLAVTINPELYKDSISLSSAALSIVFGMGEVFLGVVTFFYLIYANTFLLNMRQKEYGMFLTLGAKRSKLVQMIFFETLILGTVSTLIGILLGGVLTKVVGNLLISQLELTIPTLSAFVFDAVLWTLVFFMALFLIASFFNTQKLLRTPAIKLLKEAERPAKLYGQKPIVRLIQAVLGVAFLAVAYAQLMDFSMDNLKFKLSVIFFGILIGTYLLFNSFFTVVINLLMKNKGLSYKKIRLFTMGQVKFRINSLNTVLSIASIMFALALGAMAVGQRFQDLNKKIVANEYAVMLSTKTKALDSQIAKLHVKSDQSYDYKYAKDGKIYVNKTQLDQHPLYYKDLMHDMSENPVTKKVTKKQLTKEFFPETSPFLMISNFKPKKLRYVSATEFNKVQGLQKSLRYIRVKDIHQDLKVLQKIEILATKKDPVFQFSGYMNYRNGMMMTGAFRFMGYFLSLAFLTMLASTLMFKVLSAALQDKKRYEMLYKIGASVKVMKASIRHELAITFIVPGVMGTINVIFGLNFFKKIFDNPWNGLWKEALIFWVLYALYYLVTVKIYQKIVLKK